MKWFVTIIRTASEAHRPAPGDDRHCREIARAQERVREGYDRVQASKNQPDYHGSTRNTMCDDGGCKSF